MRVFAAMTICAGMATAASAEPVDGTTARKMLFPHRGFDVAIQPSAGLDATQAALLQAVLAQTAPGFEPRYYGAVAVSPGFFKRFASGPTEAAMSGLLQMAFDFHDTASAGAVALAECDEARKRGDGPCVVAAQILPKKYARQPLQLSTTATKEFRSYRSGKAPKALAISPSSGEFAIAKGAGAETAALTACNARAAKKTSADCTIAVRD